MSLYPIIWAAEHAPVLDATERAILVALVMKGSFDGRDCHRSYSTLGMVARCDPRTAERKCKGMEKRGILRRQTDGPKPPSWLRLPADKKTVIWEAMIPHEFFSAMQLDELNTARDERGLPPITPDSRPPLGPAPEKKTRADKGKKAPQRRPKSLKKAVRHDDTAESKERPDSQSSRSEASDRTESPVATGLPVQSPLDSQSTNPPSDPPVKTSSSSPRATSDRTRHTRRQEEEGAARADKTGAGPSEDVLGQATELVEAATGRWATGHRRPTTREQLRLTHRAAEALRQGASPEVIAWVLTHDLRPEQVRTTAVQVVMSRTSKAGWAEEDAPPAAVPAPRRPDWCGRCDEAIRMVQSENAHGLPQFSPCPDCNPNMVA